METNSNGGAAMCEACPQMIDHNRRGPSESEVERAVDRAVWRRLGIDRAYLNAESADAAQAREDEIAEEEYARISDRARLNAMQQGSVPRDIAD